MAAPTTYVVLRQQSSSQDSPGSADRWEPLAPVQAPSAEAAIRTALKDVIAGGSGTYVAVPARSWRPVTVKAETKTILSLEATP